MSMKLTGALHLHSTHSYDGKLSLTELKSFLKERGVQFACMTEHTDYLSKEFAAAFVNECHELSDDTFLCIPGFEVPYKNAHVLHIGTTEFISSVANAAQLQLWRKVSPLVLLAHPVRNSFVVDEPLLATIDGIEVWNQQYDGKALPRGKSIALLDTLRNQKPLLASGGLDFHRPEHFGSPLITLEANAFNTASIIDALKTGHYSFGSDAKQYHATGPIDFSIAEHTKSRVLTSIISFGKGLNALLAKVGLRLPARLRKAVRDTL